MARSSDPELMMPENTMLFSIFLIFTGATLVATLVLYTKQSLLVAYLLLGMLLGPWGFRLIDNPKVIQDIGNVGIIFLLFLLGLHLHPQNLLQMFRKMTWVALASSLVFALIGFGIGRFFGLAPIDAIVVGLSLMFSSTIMGLKLLPTTILHHQHTGEVMISVLLMQDLIAILALLAVHILGADHISWQHIAMNVIALPLLFIIGYIFERYILSHLLTRFDRIHEYVFLLALGWCLGMGQLAHALGVSEEVGAFIAGVAIAATPVSLFIAESLKPLRDFFLVMFFFTIGAGFDFGYLPHIWLPALLLAAIILLGKPAIFQWLLKSVGETKRVSWEVGVRLAQASEFSLLLAYLATEMKMISGNAEYLIQATTIITFVVSSYVVVLRYPTPMAVTDRLRRD